MCTACGTRLDRDWIESVGRGQPFVCPQCSSQLVETGYVEVIEEGESSAEGGREEAA